VALVSGTTLDALAAGSTRLKWVVAFDGYDRIFTDADPAKALEAWAGTDWTQALGGIVVQLQKEHAANPHEPFTGGGGRCTLHIPPDADDTFGIELNRRGTGAQTSLGATIDRNDTALVLRSNANFDASGEAHIGVECVAYSSTTSSSMTVSTRGKYTAVGCKTGADAGSGGSRFADHHRVTVDANQVQLDPVISQQPRRWIGRRVHVYLHLADSDGNLNAKSDALLVFSGRVEQIADDPNTFCTVIQCKPLLAEIGDTVIGANMWGATAMNGLYIPEGAIFSISEYVDGTATGSPNDLEVVASGAAGSNQINAGDYSLEEICDFLNAWLAGEAAATRIDGWYSFGSPVTTSAGVRTVLEYRIAGGANLPALFRIFAPAGVAGFLGFADIAPVAIGGSVQMISSLGGSLTNTAESHVSPHVPYRLSVFSLGGPGGSLPSFRILYENEFGAFVDQYDLLPTIVKSTLDSSLQWGLFLVDEKILVQASYTSGVLSNVFITPFGQTSAGDSGSSEAFYTLGRRADDDSGPVKIRQVFDLEGSFELLMNVLHYNTGTSGYNHALYDTRALGLGAGIPGGLLGDEFEHSIAHLPDTEAILRLRIDEPTTIAELIGGELIARGAFPVWKQGKIVYQRWHTPVVSLAVADLTEGDKASPAGSTDNHRTPTLETAAYSRPIVKLDFDPDFTFGRDTRYRASMQLIDHVAIDDGGGDVVRPLTIKLRNAPGKEVPGVIKEYLSRMPMTSRPSKYLQRTITSKFFEQIVPGDCVLVTDSFARDPLTGMRGINQRPAIVMRMSYDYGGPVPGAPYEKPRGMVGEVDLNFFDVDRGGQYGPCAQVDETVSAGGFSAGYNNATRELQTYDHKHSETTEALDAASFAAGYAALIVEIDPADAANPLYWQREVESVSGNKIKFTVALSAPAWDATKKYRVIFDEYTAGTVLQRDHAFQADSADELVQDVEAAFHFTSTPEPENWSYNGAVEPVEFTPEISHGDGRSLDVGHERAQIVLLNNLIDYKTAHQSPHLHAETATQAQGQWRTIFIRPIHLGLDHLSNAVFRYLTMAPFFRLDNTGGSGATTGYVRVTLSRQRPTSTIGASWLTSTMAFGEAFHQYTWATTTATWATGGDADFPVIVKDSMGFAYITIEVFDAFCRGLAKCKEGPRVLIL
jgi:hypothetical protein